MSGVCVRAVALRRVGRRREFDSQPSAGHGRSHQSARPSLSAMHHHREATGRGGGWEAVPGRPGGARARSEADPARRYGGGRRDRTSVATQLPPRSPRHRNTSPTPRPRHTPPGPPGMTPLPHPPARRPARSSRPQPQVKPPPASRPPLPAAGRLRSMHPPFATARARGHPARRGVRRSSPAARTARPRGDSPPHRPVTAVPPGHWPRRRRRPTGAPPPVPRPASAAHRHAPRCARPGCPRGTCGTRSTRFE